MSGVDPMLYSSNTGRTGMQLLEMGKTAARKYLDSQVPLDDTVTSLREMHKLSNEEVRRVCEKANHAVFLSRYHGGDTVGEFPMADSDRILGVTATKETPMAKAASLKPFVTDRYNPAAEGVNSIRADFEKRAGCATKDAPKDSSEKGSKVLDKVEAAARIKDKKTSAEARLRKAKMQFKSAAVASLRENSLCEVLESVVPFTSEGNMSLLHELDEPVARVKAASYFRVGELRDTTPEVNPEHQLVRTYREMADAHAEVELMKVACDIIEEDVREARMGGDHARS